MDGLVKKISNFESIEECQDESSHGNEIKFLPKCLSIAECKAIKGLRIIAKSIDNELSMID